MQSEEWVKLREDVAVLKAVSVRNEKLLLSIDKQVTMLRIKNAGVAAIIALLVSGAVQYIL